MDNNWTKIGYTQDDVYPERTELEVQFAVIKDKVLQITWIGRSTIQYDNMNKQVQPTHWRYVL